MPRELPEELVEGIFILAGKLYNKYGKHAIVSVTVDGTILSGSAESVVATPVGEVTVSLRVPSILRGNATFTIPGPRY